ncbi:MAG TPA: hypothetical protein VHZ24_18960 [Pirellulales bacterium]|jgi:hypothetical protein|nr:hypothetical protein [Pirellulales bacterium]
MVEPLLSVLPDKRDKLPELLLPMVTLPKAPKSLELAVAPLVRTSAADAPALLASIVSWLKGDV